MKERALSNISITSRVNLEFDLDLRERQCFMTFFNRFWPGEKEYVNLPPGKILVFLLFRLPDCLFFKN